MKPGKFPGGMGGMNMNALMKQAQKMQQDMAKKQEELKERVYEASSGGGAVTVALKGGEEFSSIKIAPAAVDPDDVEMLEDLILAAVNEAVRAAKEAEAAEMGRLTGGMNMPF